MGAVTNIAGRTPTAIVSDLRSIVSKTYDQIDATDLARLAALDKEAASFLPLPQVTYGIEKVAEYGWLPARDSSGQDAINTYRRWIDYYDAVGDPEAASLLTVEHGGFRLGRDRREQLVELLVAGNPAVADAVDSAMYTFTNSNSSVHNTRALLAAAGKLDVDLAPQINALRGEGGLGWIDPRRIVMARAAAVQTATHTSEQHAARQQLVDALDGALRLQASKRGPAIQQAVAAADHLTSLDDEARAVAAAFDPVAELNSLLSLAERDGHALTMKQWDDVVDLLEDARTSAVVPNRDMGGALHRMATQLASRQGEFTPEHRRIINAIQVARLDTASLREELASLWRRGGHDLDEAAWRWMSALSADSRAPKQVQIEGLKKFRAIARELGEGLYPYDDRVEAYFAAWSAQHDPAYVARVEAAMQRITDRRASPEDIELVTQQWNRMNELLDGKSPEMRHAVGSVMLGVDEVASTRDVRSVLAMLARNLDSDDAVTGPIATLRAQTRELVERNLARLGGRTPDGEVVGYSTHPDYAEIGRIRANLQLLERLERGATAGAGMGEDVPSSAVADTLVW